MQQQQGQSQSQQQKHQHQQQHSQQQQQHQQFLTIPSVGTSNNGLDNENSDLILAKNGSIINQKFNRRYLITEMLGQGTFGQVAKCWNDDFNDYVAVKVIKNQTAYYHQALVEVGILTLLNENTESEDSHHIVRLLDYFVFQRHLCIVFELLSINLFELIKKNHYKGLSLKLVRIFTKQLLKSLAILEDANVIHCDLKPENVLLKSFDGEIKLIDFGSACMEGRTVYSYIQSRFYRSPEVLLGHAYTSAIDMWSLGCVAAELFLGLPLFPGSSEFDLLQRMIQTLDCQPPDSILNQSKQTSRFFKKKTLSSPFSSTSPSSISLYPSPSSSPSPSPPPTSSNRSYGSETPSSSSPSSSSSSIYLPLSLTEFEQKEKTKLALSKRYFQHTKLDDIILNYSLRQGNTEEEIEQERQNRLSFIDFLKGLVEFDPEKRWSPRQALLHPFILEQPFTSPFQPPPFPRRLVRTRSLTVPQVAHNPANGHWCISGLSPRVSNMPVNTFVNGNGMNPQPTYSPFATSYGSHGTSYGSFEESAHSYSNYMHNINLEHSTPPLYPIPTMPIMHHKDDGYNSHSNALPIISPDHRRLITVLSEPIQFGSGKFTNLNMSPGTRQFADFNAMNNSVMNNSVMNNSVMNNSAMNNSGINNSGMNNSGMNIPMNMNAMNANVMVNHSRIGVSPSDRTNNYHAMSLGMSPSQYTPPLHMHSSLTPPSPATNSPLRYRMPISPLRNNSLPPEPTSGNFSPNRPISSSQYSRRRHRTRDVGLGSPATSLSYENSLLRQSSSMYPASSSHAYSPAPDYDPNPNIHKHNPNPNLSKASLKSEGLGFSIPNQNHTHPLESSARNVVSPLRGRTNAAAVATSFTTSANELSDEEAMNESPPPDPADWDPNYSDELLLQEENSSSLPLHLPLPLPHSQPQSQSRSHSNPKINENMNHSNFKNTKNAFDSKQSLHHLHSPLSSVHHVYGSMNQSSYEMETGKFSSKQNFSLENAKHSTKTSHKPTNTNAPTNTLPDGFYGATQVQQPHQASHFGSELLQNSPSLLPAQPQDHPTPHSASIDQIFGQTLTLQHHSIALETPMTMTSFINGQSLTSIPLKDGKPFAARLESQRGRESQNVGMQSQLLERSMQMIP